MLSTFRLIDYSTISLIMFLVRQFFQHLYGRNSTSLGIGDKQNKAVFFATLAQQVSANESMVLAKNQEYLQEIRDMELTILYETLGPDLDALDNYSESFANLVRSFIIWPLSPLPRVMDYITCLIGCSATLSVPRSSYVFLPNTLSDSSSLVTHFTLRTIRLICS